MLIVMSGDFSRCQCRPMSPHAEGVVSMDFWHRISSFSTRFLHLYCLSVVSSTIASLSSLYVLSCAFQLKRGLIRASRGMGSCRDGMTRTPRGMWKCKGECQARKLKGQFQLWRSMSRRSDPTRATRCDACVFAEGERLTLMVDIFCPGCSEPKTITMDRFWKEDGRNRFRNERCLSDVCKKKVYKIGRWLRMRHDTDATIRAWLAQNNCLQDNARPARMTLDLYCTQPKDAVADPIPQVDAALGRKGPWAMRHAHLLRVRLDNYGVKPSKGYNY